MRFPKVCLCNCGGPDGELPPWWEAFRVCGVPVLPLPRLENLVLYLLGEWGLTTPPVRMRTIGAAWAAAFGQDVGADPDAWARTEAKVPDDQVSTRTCQLNRPVSSGHEASVWHRELTARSERPVSALMVEFDRDLLLGPEATEALKHPGSAWDPEDDPALHAPVAHAVEDVARRLKVAGDLLRR